MSRCYRDDDPDYYDRHPCPQPFPQCLIGPAGPAGPQGMTGNTGPVGPIGPAGPGSTVANSQTQLPLLVPLGVVTPVRQLTLTTTALQQVYLTSMVEVELNTSATAAPFYYKMLVELMLDGSAIAQVTVERQGPITIPAIGLSSEIVPLMWLDVPSAGTHTYELDVQVQFSNLLANATATMAVLTATIFG